MDISHQLSSAWNHLQVKGRSICRYLATASDISTISAINSAPSLEAFALKTLGLSEKDLIFIRTGRKDRKEFIRSIIESSNPSFGRFMTEVFSHYQGLRESGKQSTIKVTDRSAILKLLRKSANELNAEELDQSRILELCTLAYRLSRASAA